MAPTLTNKKMKKKTSDFSVSLAVLCRDKKFAPLIKKYGPPVLRERIGTIDVFESLLRSIIYQQLSGYAAKAIHGRVIALFAGAKPTPAALLNIRAPRLRKAGLSIQKISYVRDLAHKCIDGTVNDKLFVKMSSQEIVEHLVAVKGIGEWTAHMLLIFTLERLDVLPVGDLAIRKGFQAVYRLKTTPTKAKMELLASPWRSHASIASWYLWKVADDAKGPKKAK